MLFAASAYTDVNHQAQHKIVVLPLGAIEQHGPHLSVATDFNIVSQVAEEAERRMTDDLLLCPALPFGSSDHHLSFGGTMSLSPDLYVNVIIDLVESLLRNGFRKIVLLNGHGGNITPVKQALAILSKKYDRDASPYIALATYWELAGKVFAGEPPMESPALSHACEYETSLMLHLFPSRVWMEKARRSERPPRNGYIGWEDDETYRGVTVFKQTSFISDNGGSGEPQKATAPKGAYLFDAAVGSLVNFLLSLKQWPLMENLSKQEYKP